MKTPTVSRALKYLVMLLAGCSAHHANNERYESPAEPFLAGTHAHNDYEHRRPLFDALALGYESVEADIHLRGGELLIGHDAADLTPERTLRALYLEPLRLRIRERGGCVYRGHAEPLWLLIDIKTDARQTYEVLDRQLADYADILTRVENGVETPGPVRVVISGNRPIARMRDQSIRYAGVDGRFSDLDSDAPANLMPLISDSAASKFRWRGLGEMPDADRAKLRDAVARAHANGRKLRLWATLDTPAVWSELLGAQVDFIGADDLDALPQFLNRRRSSDVAR